MIDADVVLRLREVHAGLAAVSGIDLGEEGGRYLNHVHPALVGGGAEPAEVPNDAPAEHHEVIRARHPEPRQLAQHSLRLGERLGALARLDLDRAGGGPDAVAVQRGDGGVADAEAPTFERPPTGVQDSLAHVDGVLARRAHGPGHPRSAGQLPQAEERRQRSRRHVLIARGQDRVGELGVDRLALGVKSLEAGAILGQRPVGSLDPPPGLLGRDLKPDDHVVAERPSHPL